jgi:hypothetical protein
MNEYTRRMEELVAASGEQEGGGEGLMWMRMLIGRGGTWSEIRLSSFFVNVFTYQFSVKASEF